MANHVDRDLTPSRRRADDLEPVRECEAASLCGGIALQGLVDDARNRVMVALTDVPICRVGERCGPGVRAGQT